MNLRANAIKENWTGYGISIKGLEELKINYITWQYFDIQNNAIYSCFMKPKPHIGDEFELYDNIKVMYGKKQ